MFYKEQQLTKHTLLSWLEHGDTNVKPSVLRARERGIY